MTRGALLILTLVLAFPAAAFDEASPEQQQSIDKAIKWLLKAQNKDGSWGLDANTPGDIACTALAGMTLISSGVSEREGVNSESVNALRKAAEYICRTARKAHGGISSGQTTLIQGKLGTHVHNFFGVVFLTQVYGMRTLGIGELTNEEIKWSIGKLSELIAKTQESDGSWHKETFGALKATGMAWLALRAASSTGVPIKHAAVDRTLKFIRQQYNPGTKLFDSQGRMQGYQSLYGTAVSVRVLVGMGEGGEAMTRNACDAFLRQVSKGEWANMFLTVEGEDYLSTVMMTHAMEQIGGERWQNWWTFIRGALCKRQNADGSWVTTACITGKTFPTACAVLALTTPNRLIPIQQ